MNCSHCSDSQKYTLALLRLERWSQKTAQRDGRGNLVNSDWAKFKSLQAAAVNQFGNEPFVSVLQQKTELFKVNELVRCVAKLMDWENYELD